MTTDKMKIDSTNIYMNGYMNNKTPEYLNFSGCSSPTEENSAAGGARWTATPQSGRRKARGSPGPSWGHKAEHRLSPPNALNATASPPPVQAPFL